MCYNGQMDKATVPAKPSTSLVGGHCVNKQEVNIWVHINYVHNIIN